MRWRYTVDRFDGKLEYKLNTRKSAEDVTVSSLSMLPTVMWTTIVTENGMMTSASFCYSRECKLLQ